MNIIRISTPLLTNSTSSIFRNVGDASLFDGDTSLALNGSDSIENKDISYRYVLSELNIVTKNGAIIPLIEVYQNISFSEDLFNNFVSGELTIVDPAGGSEKFVFSGGEEIHITLRKTFTADGMSDTIIKRNDFIITSIKNFSDEEGSSLAKYTFEFATKSFVKSFKRRIYRSYNQGTSYASIAEDLFNNNILSAGLSGIAVEDSNYGITKSMLIPGYTSHKSMQFVAQRASIEDKMYLFFERLIPTYFNGGNKVTHFFLDINSLAKQKPENTIVYAPAIGSFKDIDYKNTIRASAFSRMGNFKHFDNMMNGLYKSRITTHNIINQTIKETDYSLFDEQDNLNLLNSNLAVDSLNLFTNFDREENPAERFVPYSGNDVVSREQWVENYITKMLSIQLQRIQITISGGNNTLGVGDVVTFKCRSKLFSNGTFRHIEDKMYSGNYLITATKHYISRDGYQKKMELARDSLNINLDEIFSFKSDFLE